jgi:hypothetical protein
VLDSDLRLTVNSAMVTLCHNENKGLLSMSVILRGLRAMSVLASLLLTLMINPASANVAWLSLDEDYLYTETEDDGNACLEALMKGNLLHLDGKKWHDGQSNIEFLSFYDNKVFSFFGYSGNLVCNRKNHGGGKLRTKGLMDKEWSSK